MGRPKKQTVDYFPHFVSAGSKTIFILEQNWGNDGYSFWFKLLELLGRSEGHYFDCSAAANEKYLIALMKVGADTANEILTTLAEIGNIDGELWTQHKIIWCQSFVDNLRDVYMRRSVDIPQRPFAAPNDEKFRILPAKPTEDKELTKDDTEKKPKKRGRPKKQETPKIKYAEFVSMTEEEHGKLIKQYGADMTARMIEVLDNYKGQNGKTYKSDYRAILNWVVDRVTEEYAKKGKENYGRLNKDNGYFKQQSATAPEEFKPSGGFKKT
ncbi:MAG: DUF4373 domain-containing protein [Ruminococcus sp.]|nr:DUF4373 domain-containing protein [Ruminococcus sp.]